MEGGLTPSQVETLNSTGMVSAEMGQFNPNTFRSLTANTGVEYSVQWNGSTAQGVINGGTATEVEPVQENGFDFVAHTHTENVPTRESMSWDLNDAITDNQPELVIGRQQNKLILRQPANPPYFPDPRTSAGGFAGTQCVSVQPRYSRRGIV